MLMEFFKKVLVLSQVGDGFSLPTKRVSGIFRVEIIEGVTTLYLSTVNFAIVSGGEYQLFIVDKNKKILSIELGVKPTSLTKILENPPEFKEGFAVGISFVKDDIPSHVAFASSEEFNFSLTDYKKAVADKILLEKKKERPFKMPPPAIPIPIPTKQPPDFQPLEIPPNKIGFHYEDDVVATENYYEKDCDFQKKLKIIENLDGAYVRTENGVFDFRSAEKAQKDFESDNGLSHEGDGETCKKYSKSNPYYLFKKKELEEIFIKFPEEENLKNCIKDSRWAKITYSENKYYVVGVIGKPNEEKLICYGVPGSFSQGAPKEFKNFSSFVPLSLVNRVGDGYWIMFQDAVTGESVKQKG